MLCKPSYFHLSISSHFSIIAEVQRKYDELEGDIADRMMRLQKALTDCQSIQESLDGLLKWLEDKEKALLRMEKGMVIVVKKEPLVENLQEYRVSWRCLLITIEG